MIEIGRICVKTAGRDGNRKAVIIDVLDNRYVMIDGETRRKKCNINHLEPLPQKLDISKQASHSEVVKAFSSIGITLKESKPKNAPSRPTKKRHTKKSMTEGESQKLEVSEKSEVKDVIADKNNVSAKANKS